MLAFALLALAAPVRIHVDVALFPNAVHHLGCLSERIPCSGEQVGHFWHQQLQWSADDQRFLDQWKGTLKTVAERQARPPESPFMPNFAAYYPELLATNRIISAALASASEAEFRKRATNMALAEEIAQLSASIGHFQTRLEPWWKATGRGYAESRLSAIEARLKASNASFHASRVADFFESELPTRDFYMHLIPRADPASDAATATFVRNQMVIELTDEMQPAGVVSIILHEMTHALYELAPIARHRQLIRDFAAVPGRDAQALYAILNEGLATAVQLNALKRDGEKDDDPYRHPFIPRIGKAIAEPLDHAMTSHQTLFGGFLEAYLKAAKDELKDELSSPRFALTIGIVANFGDMATAETAFRKRFAMLTSATFEDRMTYPETNIVFLIPYDKLGAVTQNAAELATLAEKHRGFAFTMPRNARGRVYVLAGRDEKAVAELVEMLGSIATSTPEGLILSLD